MRVGEDVIQYHFGCGGSSVVLSGTGDDVVGVSIHEGEHVHVIAEGWLGSHDV